ncbi:hypothetical protein LCGC14_2591990, partial [marine sediment metagenome]
SLDSDWTDNFQRMKLRSTDNDLSNFEGDEIITIDYWFLASTKKGKGTEQDFVVGFWDEDNSQALVNISHHFFNSATFRWEIELYDSNQEIASYYYSNNYTVADVYYRAQIKYNLLEAEFEIKITHDNSTRIFSVDLFEDFTINSQFPSVFAFGIAPNIYLSTYTIFYGHQEVWIDYINAPFEEREWNEIVTPTDSNILQDSITIGEAQQGVDGEFSMSKYRLTISYLDSISGGFRLDPRNYTYASTTQVYMWFQVYAVNKTDGELLWLFDSELVYSGSNFFLGWADEEITDHPSYGGLQNDLRVIGTDDSQVAKLDFSISISEDRSKVSMQSRAYGAENDSQNYLDHFDSVDLVDVSSDVSQEFVIEIGRLFFDMDGTGTIILQLSNFDFIRKDWFQDIIINPLNDLLGGILGAIIGFFSSLLMPLFLFLASIFRVVGEAIINGLSPLLNSIISAVIAIAGPIITAVG